MTYSSTEKQYFHHILLLLIWYHKYALVNLRISSPTFPHSSVTFRKSPTSVPKTSSKTLLVASASGCPLTSASTVPSSRFRFPRTRIRLYLNRFASEIFFASERRVTS